MTNADTSGREIQGPASTEMERLYEDLMKLNAPVFRAPTRSGSLWAAMVPQIVPSVATYGAYEKPL